jgi:hypothetical protein
MASAALIGAVAMAGCGKQGKLDQPAPLFGAKAQAEYKAEKEREIRQARANRRGDNSVPDPAPPAMDAGRDPALDPLRASPTPGAPPNPFNNSGPGGVLPDPYSNPNAQPQ